MVIELIIVQAKIGPDKSDLTFTLFREIIPALLTLFFIYLVTGKEEVVFSTKGLGFAFKKGWYVLVIASLSGLLSLTLLIKKPLDPNFILIFCECVVFATCIGLFEEGLFRGLFLNALLTKYGDSFKGILKAVIISSILFGFLHVAPSFLEDITHPQNLSLIVIGQFIGKTIQTGMMGFIMAAIYLRNHNLWSIAIIHGMNDFIEFIPGYLFNSIDLGSYVHSDNGLGYIFVYLGFSILSIPFVVVGYRILKNIKIPQTSFFKACWFPLDVKK